MQDNVTSTTSTPQWQPHHCLIW